MHNDAMLGTIASRSSTHSSLVDSDRHSALTPSCPTNPSWTHKPQTTSFTPSLAQKIAPHPLPKPPPNSLAHFLPPLPHPPSFPPHPPRRLCFPADSSSVLSSFLAAPDIYDLFHVITPEPSPHQSSHSLAFKHFPHLDISHGGSSLSSRLSFALKEAISTTSSSLRSPLLSVPYDIVDGIIKQEFDKEKPVQGVYIYFLSLGFQSKNYAYSYSFGDSSPGFSKCLGTLWTGKDRYLWIDLYAGPLDYGPALSGDGVLPRGEFHPLATMHGRPKSQKTHLADLASLIWSAYRVLLMPSLRVPVHFETSLVVEFIHVYGSKSGKDSSGLDWELIERAFTEKNDDGGLLLGDQTSSFRTFKVSYAHCSICSFAISKSINSYTSRFSFDNYTLIVSEYLDSKILHQILSESADEFRRMAGSRVLPDYVFDLDYNLPLLLDRYHQSVAFRDMVIAVRTKTTQMVSDYSCHSRHVFLLGRELERPLIGSILQSMWGVPPSHLIWSPWHNTTLVDYTWSVGQTPFGPFLETSSLSFVQKDAAQRNVLLTSMNYSIAGAIYVLESMAAHGGDSNLLKQHWHVEYIQRRNLFKYKLDKAVSAISHLDFDMALYYLRSSDHDLYSIHSLVYLASQELEASLVCFKNPPFPWGSVSMSALGLFAHFLEIKESSFDTLKQNRLL